MTDYKEEQQNEIEALESIYPEEFSLVGEEPHCFQLTLVCEPQKEEDEDCRACVCLQFTYVETYPDDVPVIEIASSEGLDEEDIAEMEELLNEQAKENLGMVMVFILVSAAQEKLSDVVEKSKRKKEEEKLRIEREQEEAERVKFHGTPVTLEVFVAWRTAFEKETSLKKISKKDLKEKLTGRQLFERDESMTNSDAAFLEGTEIKVDESLFQDIDDLELDDDDLE